MTQKFIAIFCGLLLSASVWMPSMSYGQSEAPAPAEPVKSEEVKSSDISPIPVGSPKDEQPTIESPKEKTDSIPAVEDEKTKTGNQQPSDNAVERQPSRPNRLGAPVDPNNRPSGTNRARFSGRPGQENGGPQGRPLGRGVFPGSTNRLSAPPQIEANQLLSANGDNTTGDTNTVAGASAAPVEEVPVSFTTLNLENPDEIMPVGAWQIQNMPLDAFLDVYSDLVGLTVIRPATLPQAQINFKMKTPLTKRELVQALEGVLIVNQITIIPSGNKFVTATPLAEAASMGAKINEMNLKEIPESLQFMTQIVQLTNAYPSEVLPSIQPFAKIPNGIVSVEDSKLLIIRDYAVNVKRMMEIVKRVDVVIDDDYVFKVIPIHYGTVDDVSTVMSSLIGGSGSGLSSSSTRTGTGTGFSNNRFGNMGNNSFGTGSSRNSSTRSSNSRYSNSRLSVSQANMQRLGANAGVGANTFQNRMGNIMNRAANGNQQVSLLMDSAQVIPDERSNSLIVYATKRDMQVITNVIAQLDFLLPQVLIESVIVDVSLGDSFNFGVSAAQMKTNGSYSGIGGMLNGQGTYSTIQEETFGNTITNMPGGFSYFNRINDEWELGVNAVAALNKATVLQRPRILTMHGVSASFFNGQRIPYASSSYYGGYTSSANVSFDYLDVGIRLEVTPYITQEGLVLLNISQTIDEFQSWVEMGNDLRAPQTVNRDATAMIAVKNKEAIMLGGFIRQAKSKSNTGVPYLKDIPLLGYLFRSTSTTKDRSELLVFIRPTILDNPEGIREFSESEGKNLPGAYMALRNFERDTREDVLSMTEEEKANEIKEKKDLLKFQEKMKKLDEKAAKEEEKIAKKVAKKNLSTGGNTNIVPLVTLPADIENSGDANAPADINKIE
jgi:general secretion pathway protein D